VQRVQRIVAGEVARTTRLVGDMLVLARSEQYEFASRRPVDLSQFIDELWSTSTVGVNRHFQLGPVPEGIVEADADRLAQALRNLIDNAIAHTTDPDGHVALHTQGLPGGRVRFTVTDDGPGIALDQRTRIFERFHRIDEARDRRSGGAGLGLAIVAAVAEAHDGEVRATEPETIGARLELEIDRFSAHPDRGPSEPLFAR
jgi:signal transduction histidine kinase